jgi:hypothetical protein
MDSGHAPHPAERLDPASWLRLRSFAFKVLLVIPVSVAFAAQRHAPMLGAVAYFCNWYGAFSGFAAVVQHHKLGAAVLTAWDEMVAFLGLALAARLLVSLVG